MNRRRARLLGRQDDLEGGALTALGLELEAPTLPLDDALADGQAHAGPLGARRVGQAPKDLEGRRVVGLVDADALVADPDLVLRPVRDRGDTVGDARSYSGLRIT
jgi:hypothetical protein